MILIGWAHRNFFRCTLNLRHDSALDHWCLFALAWLPLALRHAQLRRLAPEQRQGPRSRRRPQTASGSIGQQAPSGSYMVALLKPCELSRSTVLNSFKFYDVTNYIKLCYIHSVWFASNCIGSHPTHRSGICRLSADADTAQVALEFIVLLKDRFDKGRWRLTYINDVNETQT